MLDWMAHALLQCNGQDAADNCTNGNAGYEELSDPAHCCWSVILARLPAKSLAALRGASNAFKHIVDHKTSHIWHAAAQKLVPAATLPASEDSLAIQAYLLQHQKAVQVVRETLSGDSPCPSHAGVTWMLP